MILKPLLTPTTIFKRNTLFLLAKYWQKVSSWWLFGVQGRFVGHEWGLGHEWGWQRGRRGAIKISESYCKVLRVGRSRDNMAVS
jgi:hypothetical protein